MFDNTGAALKKISKFLFTASLVLAIVVFGIGLFRFLTVVDFEDGYPSLGDVLSYTIEDYAYGIERDYQWYVEGYLAKEQCKVGISIAILSIACIPMYGFGCLVEDVAEIKRLMRG